LSGALEWGPTRRYAEVVMWFRDAARRSSA